MSTTQDPKPPTRPPDENEVDRAAWDGLPSGLDSGDIVIFNRRCMSMSVAGAALCLFAKLFSNSAWDHVGMVIRHPDTGELLFLEADFGGVKLRSLTERVKRSQSREIAVRKLSVVRTDSMRRTLYDFACEMRDTPYNTSPTWVVNRVSNQAIKQERAHYHAKYAEKQSRLEQIDLELKHAVLSPAARRYLLSERKRVEVSIEHIVHAIDRLQREALKEQGIIGKAMENPIKSGVNMQMAEGSIAGAAMPSAVMYGEYSQDLSRVFCSELVAVAYQRLGLLDSYPPAESFDPTDFSTDRQKYLNLRKGASLAPEIYLRISEKRVRQKREQKKNDESARSLSVFQKSKSLRGISAGDNPGFGSRKVIKEALRRSPVYRTIPDEMKRVAFMKSFEAVIIEAGEVIFEQGEYGNELYVIEEGKVDRFVRKGNESPIHTNILGPQSCFGHTGFVFTVPRSATIRARERTLVWKVNRETYETFKDADLDPESSLVEADRRILRRILANHFLFSRLDRLGTKEVNAFFPVKFRAGEVIFKQGDVGDNFYIIKSGEVERHIRHPKKSSDEEDEVSLAMTLRSGQSFGELSLMYDAPRGATTRARTDVECFAISNEQFHKLNLGRGTEFLRTRFNRSASITRDGDKYMTTDDFLTKIANADEFRAEDRARLSWLLASLVSNNRERDPVRALRNEQKTHKGEGPEVLMNFWDFARMEIVLNHPAAEQNLAFQLADQDNTGFISFDEIQSLLQVYADIDESARQVLSGESRALKQAFGNDGSRLLSAEEFNNLSKKILPKQFVKDVEDIARHMSNVQINAVDEDDLRFVKDRSPSMIGGSNFVSASSPTAVAQEEVNKQRDSLASSVIASALARTAVAPLERLKILIQADTTGKYRGLISGFRNMLREDPNVGKALFRGNAVNVVRIIPSVLLQASITKWLVDSYAERDTENRRVRNFDSLCLSGLSGIMTASLLYPLEFAHGRLSVQNANFQPCNGFIAALRQSVAQHGFRSIYRGIFPSMLGTFAYTGINYSMYEAVRPVLPRRHDGSHMPSAASTIVSGAFISLTAQSIALPFDTVRRRMQIAGFGNNESVLSFPQTVKAMYQQSGIRVFFRGLLPNALKITPMTAVGIYAAEYTRNVYSNGVEQWKSLSKVSSS